MPKINDRETREVRKNFAKASQAAHAQRSAEQQLAALDQRLGAGVGATKERARLAASA